MTQMFLAMISVCIVFAILCIVVAKTENSTRKIIREYMKLKERHEYRRQQSKETNEYRRQQSKETNE